MRPEDARAILDASAEGLARLDELTELNEGLAAIAQANAETAVALLSVIPLVSRDPVGLGFVGDAMANVRTSTDTVERVQTALQALIEHELTNVRRLQAKADELDDEPGFSRGV